MVKSRMKIQKQNSNFKFMLYPSWNNKGITGIQVKIEYKF